MRRSFSFRARSTCSATGVLIDVLVVYFGQTPVDITVINDEIQNALKVKDPIPDALYIITQGKQGNAISSTWKTESQRIQTLMTRGSSGSLDYLKDVEIFQFSGGEFVRVLNTTDPVQRFSIPIASLLEKGMADLVKLRGAYQIAPAGHVFKHPSGKRSRHFLLASELLNDEVDVYFVALCICSSSSKSLNFASRLYIDTMGIYPIARAVKDIVSESRELSQSEEIEICSFHSHDGLLNFYPTDTDSSVVLISASTSGNMAMQLGTEKRFKKENVVTLLDLQRTGRYGVVVYEHEKHQDSPTSEHLLEAGGYETPIELVGEYFAARGKRPKALTLTLAHAPQGLKDTLIEFWHADDLALQRQRPHAPTAVDPITLTQSRIVASERFQKWLTEELRLRTPASISHILAAQGNDSLQLANFCAEQLRGIFGRSPTVLPYEEIRKLDTENSTGVLVCTALVGNGHALRVTARDIRELAPKASRHFVIGIGLPDTLESWERLRQFLVQSGDKARPYLFACWINLPIGVKRPHDSWTRYGQLMQRLEHLPTDLDSNSTWGRHDIKASLDLAMSDIERAAESMLPTAVGSSMVLTEGFVYWDANAEQLKNTNHHALSYLALSSVLQNAREVKDPQKRLKSTLYETVVLDPENFLRFNDGVLQAGLLRAANSFELNYSMSPDQSQSMREILEKVFANSSKRYGEAALEFAIALASGHLKLTDADCGILLERVAPALGSQPSSLTGLLFYTWTRLPNTVRTAPL